MSTRLAVGAVKDNSAAFRDVRYEHTADTRDLRPKLRNGAVNKGRGESLKIQESKCVIMCNLSRRCVNIGRNVLLLHYYTITVFNKVYGLITIVLQIPGYIVHCFTHKLGAV
jgi:hypothetical protein